MIAVLLLVALAAVALLGLDRGSRRRRALRVVGRLATPGTPALPPAADELRAPCGHLAAIRCGCAERGEPPAWADPVPRRDPPWARDVPVPRPPLPRLG